jgi:hypothetical protein
VPLPLLLPLRTLMLTLVRKAKKKRALLAVIAVAMGLGGHALLPPSTSTGQKPLCILTRLRPVVWPGGPLEKRLLLQQLDAEAVLAAIWIRAAHLRHRLAAERSTDDPTLTGGTLRGTALGTKGGQAGIGPLPSRSSRSRPHQLCHGMRAAAGLMLEVRVMTQLLQTLSIQQRPRRTRREKMKSVTAGHSNCRRGQPSC